MFSSYPITFIKNPIIGLGPGRHALNGFNEYHNTYLEVLAMGGLLGGLVFTIFSVRIFKSAGKFSLSLAIITALYAYGFSGFGMRRLIFWIFLCLAILMANKSTISGEEIKNEKRNI